MAQLQPGENLGPYQIISQVGKGGMATVYKAFHAATNRYVAIKVLPESLAENPEFTNRFRQEVRTIANLQHPQILPVFDYGEGAGRMYMVMRYLDTGTLKERMENRLSLAQIDRLFSQLLSALDYAHTQGVVHRDIKPSNALVDSDDNLFLTDFGIAKILEKQTQFTETGALIGTPDYMSPEQAQGMHLDRRSDIYSLGVILYEMVTGHVPFEAETPLAVILKHIHDPLPPPSVRVPGLSPAIEAVILRVLSKRPEDRFATCREFLEAWKQAVSAAGGQLTSNFSVLPANPAAGTLSGTRPVISPPTGAAGRPLPAAPPSTGSGSRDLLIVFALGGVILVIVCLVVAAGLGGLSLLSGRLGQAATPTRVAQATEGAPTSSVENTPVAGSTQVSPTEAISPTEPIATAAPVPLVEAINISNTQFESEYPQILMDDQDQANVIWSDKTERKEGDVLYARSSADGGWSTPERISSGNGTLVGGSLRWLKQADGTPCALWYALEWTLRCRADNDWAEPKTLDIAASWADDPAFAYTADDELVVAWYQFSDVYFNGTVVSDGRNSVHDLRMVLDDELNPHLAWIEQDNGQFIVRARYSPDGGQTWDEIKTLSEGDTNPGLGSPFDLASDQSGKVHVAWGSQGGPTYYTFWKGDVGWATPEALNGGRPLIDLSLAANDDGYAQLVASGLVGGRQGILIFQQTEAGWTTAQLLAEDTGEISVPSRNARIAIDSDYARHVVWQSANSTPDIFYAQLP